jgi:hypothetical protein
MCHAADAGRPSPATPKPTANNGTNTLPTVANVPTYDVSSMPMRLTVPPFSTCETYHLHGDSQRTGVIISIQPGTPNYLGSDA